MPAMITAATRSDNSGALAFYRRLGFQVVESARKCALVDGARIQQIVAEESLDSYSRREFTALAEYPAFVPLCAPVTHAIRNRQIGHIAITEKNLRLSAFAGTDSQARPSICHRFTHGGTSLRVRSSELYRKFFLAFTLIIQIRDDWDSFALENLAPNLNRASVLGTTLWSHVVGEEARQLYQQVFRQVRRLQASASIPFRCDSPGKRRFLRPQIDPMPDSRLRMTTLTEKIEERPPVDLPDPTIARSDAVVTLCGWGKKVNLPDDRWVEAENAINSLRLFDAKLPQLSHGICGACSKDFRRGLKEPAAAD